MINLKQNYIAYKAIVRKEILRFFRAWAQSFLPAVITSILYFIIFGRMIGPRIGNIAGASYIQYIAPGLIMMWVINNSYSKVTAALFIAKFQRNIEEMLVSPTANSVILLGYVSAGVACGLIIGFIVTIITLFFTHLTLQHPFITGIVILLSALLFSLAGFVNGIYAKTFDDAMIIATFVLTPLIYLGGVFYSLKMLSPFWQKISYANPVLYMIDAFRYGILGISHVSLYFALSMIIAFIACLFMFCLYLLNKGIGIRS